MKPPQKAATGRAGLMGKKNSFPVEASFSRNPSTEALSRLKDAPTRA